MEHWAQNVEKHHSADSSGWVQMELVMTEMQRSLNARSIAEVFSFKRKWLAGEMMTEMQRSLNARSIADVFSFKRGLASGGRRHCGSLVALDLLPRHSGHGSEVGGLQRLAGGVGSVQISRLRSRRLREPTSCEDSG